MRTLRTFLPTMTIDITTGSSSCGTSSSKSELVKHRSGSGGWSGLLASRNITSRTYRLRLEVELAPLENPLEMVFSSMDWYLMHLVPEGNCSLWLFLINLKVLLQEAFLHQACQMVTQSYALLDFLPKSLVELTPDVLSWPQIPISLLRKLQLFRYA